MGKRGPKPLSAAELRRRGSHAASSRARAESKTPSRRPRSSRAKPGAAPAPRRPLPKTLAQWRALCASLPSYDPWKLAGHEHVFDAKRAGAAIDWIEEHIRHVKGRQAGQLLRLEDWQRAIVANLFGWVDRATGLRRYRRALIYVPRKNAKTTLAAAIALYVFFEDKEPGAEMYSGAAKEKQAKIVWKIAKGMIVREPKLKARCRIYVSSIVLDDGESFFQPIASEGKSEHGANTHFAVIDELHAQANSDLMEAISTSFGGREQPMLLLLTTADAIGETVCNEELAYAKEVRANPGDEARPGHDPAYLPVIYEASREEDWTSEATWRKANPLYDASPTIQETLRQELAKAKSRPAYASAFRRWYLNVQTETATAWLNMEHWDQCGGVVDLAALKGQACFAGVDMSATTDLTAVVLWFPSARAVLPFFWVPEEAAVERERRNDPLYKRWGASGHLTLTRGNVIDEELIKGRLLELAKTYRIQKAAVDRAYAVSIANWMQANGFEVEYMPQGWVTMTAPCRELETMLARGQVRHGGHPVLRWNATNAKVVVGDHGGMAPVKPKGTAKIDGIVALLMALRLSLSEPVAKKTGSVYERREAMVLG